MTSVLASTVIACSIQADAFRPIGNKLTAIPDLVASFAHGFSWESKFWMPPNGALHGVALDQLMKINLSAIGVLFLIAHLLLCVALLRRYREARPPRFWLAGSLPLILVCGLYLWMTITAQHLWALNRFEGPSPAAMQVEVVGVQFQWYFRYPGADATFGETHPELVNAASGNPLGLDPSNSASMDDVVSSELVLPAGREVDLRLRAHDVIHGFFLPAMRLKQNAVPGLTLHVHFTPMAPGEYPILCTQVCGLGHGHMQARLRVLPVTEFESWLADRERKRLAQQAAAGSGS
jgi:cytochrome c oxidase subunit 2